MTSINLVFRPSTRPGRQTGSLSVRLVHRRHYKTFTLAGCRVYADEWDRQSQSVVYPADNPCRSALLREVENVLERETGLLAGFILSLENRGRYTLEDLTGLYRQKRDDGKLLGYADGLAAAMEERGQYRTAKAYRTVTRGIVRLNKGADIPLHHINARLIGDFEAHLRERELMPNTISFYMRNLRAIYNKAAEEKLIVKRRDENPFEGVFIGVTKTMKRALSLDEIQKLKDLDFGRMLERGKTGKREEAALRNLHAAHRYFGFCLYARGMCFIDMAFLQKKNLRGGFIRYIRKKTGRQIEVRVTPEMKEIIDSFAHETAGSPYLFPVIRDEGKPARLRYESALRTQNSRLKKLSSMAGIGPRISTHWARHSWATMGKQLNVPTSVISECLGHTSENTTLIYLAQLNNSVLDEANERIALAINTARPVARAQPVF